jgi:hypothetical protein
MACRGRFSIWQAERLPYNWKNKEPGAMTTHHTFPIAVCCLFLSSVIVAAAEPAPSPSPGSEEARVIEVMRTFYVAATNDDLEKFHTVVTRDFYSYDGGARFTGDELMALIKAAHASGKVFLWNVTKPEVRMHGEDAWITYVNEGSVKDASGTKNVTWLESAFLRKENDNWRIEFFHSTRVP